MSSFEDDFIVIEETNSIMNYGIDTKEKMLTDANKMATALLDDMNESMEHVIHDKNGFDNEAIAEYKKNVENLEACLARMKEEKQALIEENTELRQKWNENVKDLQAAADDKHDSLDLDEPNDQTSSFDTYRIRECLLEQENLVKEIKALEDDRDEVKQTMTAENTQLRDELIEFTTKLQLIEDKLQHTVNGRQTGFVDVSALLDAHLAELHQLKEENRDLQAFRFETDETIAQLANENERKERHYEENENILKETIKQLEKEKEKFKSQIVQLNESVQKWQSENADLRDALRAENYAKDAEIRQLQNRLKSCEEEVTIVNRRVMTKDENGSSKDRDLELYKERWQKAEKAEKFAQKENERLTNENQEINKIHRKDERNIERLEALLKSAEEDKELYKNQAIIFEEDFRAEREGRQKLAGKLADLEERVRLGVPHEGRPNARNIRHQQDFD